MRKLAAKQRERRRVYRLVLFSFFFFFHRLRIHRSSCGERNQEALTCPRRENQVFTGQLWRWTDTHFIYLQDLRKNKKLLFICLTLILSERIHVWTDQTPVGTKLIYLFWVFFCFFYFGKLGVDGTQEGIKRVQKQLKSITPSTILLLFILYFQPSRPRPVVVGRKASVFIWSLFKRKVALCLSAHTDGFIFIMRPNWTVVCSHPWL